MSSAARSPSVAFRRSRVMSGPDSVLTVSRALWEGADPLAPLEPKTSSNRPTRGYRINHTAPSPRSPLASGVSRFRLFFRVLL